MPSPERRILARAFHAAIAAADPASAMHGRWPAPPLRHDARIVILSIGKAGAAMARAARAAYGDRADRIGGVVVVPAGTDPAPPPFDTYGGDHPVPGGASERAGRALLGAVDGAREGDLVVVLVSGGGSALAVAPRPGVDLTDLAALNASMLSRGMDVRDMNLVRRHVDLLKGGGLARSAGGATVRAFVVSDVVGDDPADVASGPTVSAPWEPEAALAILDRYEISAPAVRSLLASDAEALDAKGRHVLRGRPGWVHDRDSDTVTTVVVSARTCLEAACRSLEQDGATVHAVHDAVVGDAQAAALATAHEVQEVIDALGRRDPQLPCSPRVLVSGGETTVRVRGNGSGGRNQVFALALALALPDGARVHALVADSDGIDGVGGAAGAFVGPSTFDAITRCEARAMLDGDDSGGFFRANGDAFVTGPTGTNVNDLRFVWVDARQPRRSDPAPPRDAHVEPRGPHGLDRSATARPRSSRPKVASPSSTAIEAAAAILARGGLVGLPTETVYGLAGRARDPRAVEAIYAAKGRPLDHPVIVHVGEAAEVAEWAEVGALSVDTWVEAFWPGPLTLVLPARADVPRTITGGQDTVAVRMPSHPVALRLLRTLGEAVVAPSANRFGQVSPTTPWHVEAEFPGLDLLVLDGGPCDVGLESTIVDLTGGDARILRPGRITTEEVREVAARSGSSRIVPAGRTDATAKVTDVRSSGVTPLAVTPRVPGALARHYAPSVPTVVVDGDLLRQSGPGDAAAALLVTSAPVPPGHLGPVERLDPDPASYARGLYAALRRLDAAQPSRIVVERPPRGPAWTAVHDRLSRAATALDASEG